MVAEKIDRNVQYYQVDCHETSKDNPVLSQEAAGQAIAESAFTTQTDLGREAASQFSHAAASVRGNDSQVEESETEIRTASASFSQPTRFMHSTEMVTSTRPTLASLGPAVNNTIEAATGSQSTEDR